MVWNPSPKVAAARDIADRWNLSHVIIVMIDDKTGDTTTVTYGENRGKCAAAEKLGEVAHVAIIDAWEGEK